MFLHGTTHALVISLAILNFSSIELNVEAGLLYGICVIVDNATLCLCERQTYDVLIFFEYVIIIIKLFIKYLSE